MSKRLINIRLTDQDLDTVRDNLPNLVVLGLDKNRIKKVESF